MKLSMGAASCSCTPSCASEIASKAASNASAGGKVIVCIGVLLFASKRDVSEVEVVDRPGDRATGAAGPGWPIARGARCRARVKGDRSSRAERKKVLGQ